MRNAFNRLSGKQESASQAKERLQLVLIHDRANLPPGVMDSLRDELIEVISRHVDVERDSVVIEIAQQGREQRLVADIPIRPPRKRSR
jgi:cell division topological specificity factor